MLLPFRREHDAALQSRQALAGIVCRPTLQFHRVPEPERLSFTRQERRRDQPALGRRCPVQGLPDGSSIERMATSAETDARALERVPRDKRVRDAIYNDYSMLLALCA